MSRVFLWGKWLTATIGGPGLFVIAFLDSSVLSLPEINDILVVWMVMQHKERMLYYALLATLGSITGCFLLYWIGRTGGDAVLRKRFQERHIEKGMRLFQRFGLLAVLVPAILPPPAPFKIFVLLAGVARVPIGTFALAIGVGRGLRYVAEGLLAIFYGDMAIAYIRENGKPIAIVVAVLVLLAGIAYVVWRARTGQERGPLGER